MASASTGKIVVKIETSDGSIHDISDKVVVVNYGGTYNERWEQRKGFIGWLAWKLNIIKLKWIVKSNN